MRYDSLCEAQQILCRYTARIVVWNTTDMGDNMENLKLGDIVEYKGEVNEPCVFIGHGSRIYSVIRWSSLYKFISWSLTEDKIVYPVKDSSTEKYKSLKEIGDFLKRVRIDVIDNEEPKYNSYQESLTVLRASSIANTINEAFKYAKCGFSETGFITEVSELLYDMFYDDGVTTYVYTVGNHT